MLAYCKVRGVTLGTKAPVHPRLRRQAGASKTVA